MLNQSDVPLLDGRLKDILAGKFAVLTGVTGFIGEQILWKVLTELPDTTMGVLVRRKGDQSAYDRMVELVNKDIFRDLREAAGGAEQLLERSVRVIEGDLPNVPDLPGDLDVLIHCAGDVSFDPPIDAAFKTNVLGTRALMTKLLEAVPPSSGRVPHYVHISTAYTAGRRRGPIPESAHEHDVDYAVETEWSLKLAERIEIDSRTPERLAQLRREAEREHSRAGYLTTAADTERRRQEWVAAELVTAGTERARSLGWTDAYTFAKAMGERIVADLGRDIRVSIVRPAIVESSLKHPFPGWIEGFKMAEPLIMAYGKGSLPELPATPDAVIDIVPCDYVVNAIIAVCATEPAIGRPEFFHINSGARNPLTFRDMYLHVRQYFTDHPFDNGSTKELPLWSFPGAARVERVLTWTERASDAAGRALAIAPRSARTRRASRSLEKSREQMGFLRRYLALYGEYLRSELHFVDDHTLALHRSLDRADVAAFGFDTADIDWTEYLERVHCPSVTTSTRARIAERRARGPRKPVALPTLATAPRAQSPSTPAHLADDPSRVVAVFDLHGTVMGANVIETYLWARLGEASVRSRASEVVSLASALPDLYRTERADRGSFLRASYRRYAGMHLADLEKAIDEKLGAKLTARLVPDAVRRIEEHRDAGHRTILMTGAIRPFTRPLAHLFDEVVAADLATDANGRCNGFLTGPPMVGEWRSSWLRHWADRRGVDLAQSYAYADSLADLPLLSAVGHPVAVNADLDLMRAATARKWAAVEWPRANGH
ncbi:HAD-IB family hydrolase [Mariniluteicoccus flavus]